MSYTAPTDLWLKRFSPAPSGGLQASAELVGFWTPSMYDIAAIQSMYGADPNTRSGATTYTWNASTPVFQVIYDAGGIDIYDLSGHTRPSYIDLRPGAYSSIDYYSTEAQIAAVVQQYGEGYRSFITNWVNQSDSYTWSDNVGIAFGTVIENVALGEGDDIVTGNDAGNTLHGNGGNDILSGEVGNDFLFGDAGSDILAGGAGTNALDGGAGRDQANFGVNAGSATITHNGNGTWGVSGAGFSDTLTGIEALHFADTDLALASTTTALVLANFGRSQGWSSSDAFLRALADVNGDGKADIVGFGQAGVLTSLATVGGNFAGTVFSMSNFGQAQGWSSDRAYHRVLADVNGDHKADVVGFGQAGTFVSLATGAGTFGTATIALNNFGVSQGWGDDTTYRRDVADVNGDGRADIVGFGQLGVYVALATANGQFGAATLELANFTPGAGGWNSDDQFHRELADVNGDGRADIVGFGQAGVVVSLATGSGHFAAATTVMNNFGRAQGWSTQDLYPRHLADANGDGRADLIGFGQSSVFVSLATGNGQFAAATASNADFTFGAGGWGSNNFLPRLLGDVTGDGHADIVGFGATGTLSALLIV